MPPAVAAPAPTVATPASTPVPSIEKLVSLPEGPEKRELRQQVIREWLPMAERLSTRFHNRGESAEDLRQIASLGLVKAVDRFDPGRGHAFESFAVPTIVGEIKRHFRDHTWGVHVPRRVQELRNQVRSGTRELSAAVDHRTPSVAQVAEHTGLSEDEVRVGRTAMESYKPLSLDAEVSAGAEDGYSLADTLGASEPGYDRVVLRETVRHKLRSLPERERRILYLRYFCDMTQSRIARECHLSQMHVSRILSGTCSRIRRAVEREERRERVV
ncbi:SigB/SigF/SigG family RNA polymerase sigma factor [Streptomyces sp. MST-110588]|uniref:SigB/SigF/SigG family RNA polymerase sigma factor n=1 Tax=Streptomyces sp. MST-110588 TaxID=2833628 RepID=UPI001F5C85C8|nr:SigB/SigF/SigG family RNA polymerase sigma factor [Streptomyces sp. MST-110588]UNO38828.1 SigB/SigF/SigG family RNA polymerase sigma factor [Streptomyces sp. MST-110588]